MKKNRHSFPKMPVKKLPIDGAQYSSRSKESDLAIRTNPLQALVGRNTTVCGVRKNKSDIAVYSPSRITVFLKIIKLKFEILKEKKLWILVI